MNNHNKLQLKKLSPLEKLPIIKNIGSSKRQKRQRQRKGDKTDKQIIPDEDNEDNEEDYKIDLFEGMQVRPPISIKKRSSPVGKSIILSQLISADEFAGLAQKRSRKGQVAVGDEYDSDLGNEKAKYFDFEDDANG